MSSSVWRVSANAKIKMRAKIEKIYKAEAGRVLATLMRLFQRFDTAEEALQEAFLAAVKKWPLEGIPRNPYAWLVSAGKFKAIDAIRRSGREKELLEQSYDLSESQQAGSGETNDPALAQAEQMQWEQILAEDDQLRLIFFCCHPLLPRDSRIALSLKEVCGMNTAEIARAYLLPVETVKKRIARAKTKIRESDIRFEIPSKGELSRRIDAVLQVVYLIYNQGYAITGDSGIPKKTSEGFNVKLTAAKSSPTLTPVLTQKALYLSRTTARLMATPDSLGLLALLLLLESRNRSRQTPGGEIIPLERQDRSLWNRGLIREGIQLIQSAMMSGRPGPYVIQAAIAATHAVADSVQNTDWKLIVDYYDMLFAMQPSPVIALNRAIAVGMKTGPRQAFDLLLDLGKDERLKSYHPLYAAKAEFAKRLRLKDEAAAAYRTAIRLAPGLAEKQYLKNELAKIESF